ncbi:lethal(3)malignant brain tumor-like protein 4 isoform X1 [Acyrthosiphon pisum]|uniref:SAM domain-containing protein n=2 Tax=Acyrthosiphon pisum TaxID=7029 RepID=A0A8R2NU44_ACYPI|nr:lethal(3)malignant brain tumor-like protein 4 isoform X1 [Acyrthosiphon pisum]
MIQFQNKSAPKKLFDRPFPTEKNCFVVGQKLEGIDPKHVALFCVMTISEVCGYRIKLHFDGYQCDYDFWVNADCPDLFYPGWCKLNSRILQPPKDYGKKFDWITYLREAQAFPAPKHNFVSTKHINSSKSQHKFHIGGKLEALDKVTRVLARQLICVATVVDILGNRVRIHLDGRTDDSDYWVDISSNNIYPVRWCGKNGKTLIPPKGYKNTLNAYKDSQKTKTFNWTEYLKETNSDPVPDDAFVRRPIRDFCKTMIIEVVDIVVPKLLRIARVVDVRNSELKIIYDGFDKEYEYWVEDDSPDIHPVGWSSQTNHPIEVPPETHWYCLVPGCKGYGNSSNSLKMNHDKLEDCPYEIDSWKTAIAGLRQMPDRLKIHNVLTTTTSTLASSKTKKTNVHHNKNKEKNIINTEHTNFIEIKEKINEKRLNFLLDPNNIEPKCDTAIENTLSNDKIPSIDKKKLCKNIGLSLAGFISNSVSTDTDILHGYWTIHNDQLGIPLFNTTDVRTWSVHEVALYVKKVVANYKSDRKIDRDSSISDRFINQVIDGESFLMLNQNDLMDTLKIPLGPAIKIFNAITTLRHRTSDYDLGFLDL